MAQLGRGGQFLLLFWKEWVLLKQKKLTTLFQILLPIVFSALLVIIRTQVNNANRDDKTWTSFQPKTYYNKGLSRTVILYTPNLAAVDDVMTSVGTALGGNFTVTAFASESDLNTYKDQNPDTVWAAVIFDTSTSFTTTLPNNVKYTLRVTRRDPEDEWQTADAFPFFQRPGNRTNEDTGGEPYYYDTGFLGLQYLIDNAIINKKESGTTYDTFNILLQKMPYIAHVSDGMIPVVQNWLPLFVLLAFIITALQTTKTITYEKERRLKEAMKLMGMNNFIYWLAVFLKALIFSLIAIIFFIILLKLNTPANGRVLSQSNAGVLLLFLLIYAVSLISYCIMMSTFFSKANIAAAAAAVLYILLYVPWFFITSRYEDWAQGPKLACCLMFNTAMAMGFNTIGLYEGAGDGAQFTNFYNPATVDDNLSLLQVMVMLIVDAIIMLLIAWYVGAVFPGEFGVPLPFYFPCTKSYWCGATDPDMKFDDVRPKTSPQFFERAPEGLTPGIEIKDLRKVFGRGGKRKVAVAGTNLTMYKGQITALLGHNGAGKTTTMSMLTGFIPPTRGTARINDHDIVTNIDGVRRSLGLCPQHDILFDTMSVENHLHFYAKLKGVPKDKIKQEVNDMIEVVGLQTKKDALSMTLSGGQKRKLSVGIALIGGSEVVILDEPTSGMDPGARRQTWEILQRFRKDRCMVLSTHFMDEADVLGDRIAIMAEGVVKCCGTSLFLKKAFGAGYHLVMVKSTSGCNVDKVTQLIQSYVKTAVKESEISMELSYLLPFDQSAQFMALFAAIEKERSSLGIASFGTSATTMEEVFLKVGESGVEDTEDAKEHLNPVHRPMSASGKADGARIEENGFVNDAFERGPDEKLPMKPITNGVPRDEGKEDTAVFIETNESLKKNHGFIHSVQQFWGMFVKRVVHTWRNRVVTIVQLLLPILFTIFALLVESTAPGYSQEPALELNLSPYGSYVSMVSDATSAVTHDDKYKALFCSGCVLDLSASSSFDAGSLDKMRSVGISSFSASYIIGADFTSATDFIAYFNGEPYHSPAISLNFLNNALLKSIVGDTHSITTINYPFDKSLTDNTDSVAGTAFGVGFSIAFLILFGMAFLSTSFLIFLIKERMNGAKHLQKVSGVGSFVFWLSTFAWDFINYMIPAVLCVVVFAAFNTAEYSGGNPSRIGLVFWTFVTYGWTCLPFIYIFHFAFKTPAGGMVAMTLLNIITGLATLITVFVLNIPGLGTEDIAEVLDWIFALLIPHYNLGMAIMNIYVNYNYIQTCEAANYKTICASGTIAHPCCDYCTSNCLVFKEDYLDMASPGVGKNILFMALQGVVFFTVILLVEYQVFTRLLYVVKKPRKRSVGSNADMGEAMAGEQVDDDVMNEQKRINGTAITALMESDKLIIKNISKHYGNFHAVRNISVGVASQECFGLLGQNGAGKTTTFKMLTGDEMITSGNAYLEHHDVKQDIKQVQKNLGYCPQFDGLIEQMTGREILIMFARLRGVHEDQIKGTVQALIKALMLEKHADRECGTYSGGNKRKLSTAMALIGNPPFIFLDEPTTGMDPGARRQLWNVLSQIRASGRTLVLTSHSMEECDALCTRIVIMVNGRFVCLGSPQHLKNKFGHGYTLIVQLGLHTEAADAVQNFVKENFPSSSVFDNHQGYLHFQIPESNVSLSDVFGVMENAKSKFEFEDYSVHQTTLEQVFLQFTRNQHLADDRKKKSTCLGCC